MAKVVAFLVLATAFVILIITSRINKHNSPSIFGLNRRLGYTFPIPTFDPLVVKIQRAAEAKGLIKKGNPIGSEERNSNIVVETENAYEYLSENGTLNMTLRLMFIFPLLNNASKDGKVSFEELQQWNKEQAIERLTYRTDKEMELHDKDGDGMINFFEYLPQFSKEDIDENSTAHGEAGWWMLQFKNADIDQNGFLDYDEFNDFLHPEDTNNDKIQRWMLREKIRLMDDDGDGKLNFAEFSMHVYSIYKIYGEFEASRSNLATAKEKFEELDTNKDEFLEVKELLPILCYLKPGELSYAKYYASYLIQEADDNGDNYLTLDEMLNHENTFYTTMYDNDDYDDDFHDEL